MPTTASMTGFRSSKGWSKRGLVVRAWVLCSIFRLLNTTFIDSYFDPDEFWQTLEPAYCLAFGGGGARSGGAGALSASNSTTTTTNGSSSPYATCPGFTWEWKRRASHPYPPPLATAINASLSHSPSYSHSLYAHYLEPSLWGPARAHLPILPTYLLYRLLKRWGWDSSWAVARGPMLLNAVLFAAPVDVSVLYAASYLYKSSAIGYGCLLACLLSWFNLYSLVRTFSNSQETALLMVAVALVAPELLQSDGEFSSHPHQEQKSSSGRSSWRRACLVFYLGGLSTAIRFTSLAAFVPMGLLLAFRHNAEQAPPSQRTVSTRLARFVIYLLGPCATCGLLGIITSLVLDRIFYGFWTIPFLALIHFNVILNFAELYGSHPWHWYLTAGLPAISGLLIVPLLLGLVRMCTGTTPTPRGIRNLWCILICYITIMSLNSHKEFRYIHPVLPLVCLLTGPDLYQWDAGVNQNDNLSKSSPRTRWWSWRTALAIAAFGLANLLPALYLGWFHQSGPVIVNRDILDVACRRTTHALADAPTQHFTVYYWTGECHSTPLHSHLHHPRNPSLAFDTWALDCSPSCRTDSNPLACETNRFRNDPVAFVREALCQDDDKNHGLASNGTTSITRDDLTTKCRPVPDFVVTFSSHARQLDPMLQHHLGMRVVGRYPLHVTGVALRLSPSRCWHAGGNEVGLCDTDDATAADAASSVDRVHVGGTLRHTHHRSLRRIVARRSILELDVETEDVVLYSRRPTSTSSSVDGTCDAQPLQLLETCA